MNTTIDITPSESLKTLFTRAASLPQRTFEAVAAALNQAGPVIVGNAVENRFLGVPGPFPISEHKLGRRTGRLRQSIRNTVPQIEEGSSTVTMGFGSNVKYFFIHEFGFNGPVNVRAHLRKNGQSVRGHTRFVKVEAREPMQTELRHPRTSEVIFEYARRQIASVVNELEGGLA